jgi:hypothetical protein
MAQFNPSKDLVGHGTGTPVRPIHLKESKTCGACQINSGEPGSFCALKGLFLHPAMYDRGFIHM